MLAVRQDTHAIVNCGPPRRFVGRTHCQLGPRRIARLWHIVGRGDFLDIDRVGEPWRAQPDSTRSEAAIAAARFAVAYLPRSTSVVSNVLANPQSEHSM